MRHHSPEQRGPTVESQERRAFLKKAARRSLAAAGLAAAASAAAYRKPALRSFLPEVTVYAQTTGAGKFSLKGTT
jgi:hypothetical protein